MKKPNIIYIFADQLRRTSIGFCGDERAITPNIDKFATESSYLSNAVSGHPVCAPYRASLFTGKYTTSTGMVINEIRMNPNHDCLASELTKNGYETAYIGKWHMYAAEFANHYDPKNSFVPKGKDRLGFDDFFAAYGFHHNYYGSTAYYHLDNTEKVYCEGYEPDVQTDLAIENLERLSKSDKPFALFLSLGTPHDPWVPENVPGKYLEKFDNINFELPVNYKDIDDIHADKWAKMSEADRRNLLKWMKVYYAMVANLDHNIGRLMESIKSLGLDKDSVVVFTSDHGEMFGAQGRRAKNIFYNEAVEVPFFIKYGENFTNKEYKTPFNTVDIMPTLLDLCEVDIPKAVEGKSIAKNLFNDTDETRLEGSFMMGTGATAKYADGHEWRAYRTSQYTYAIYLVDNQEFLFDNIKDHYQMNNLINDVNYKGICTELKEKMHAQMTNIKDEFKPCSYYEKNWIEDRVIKRTATINC